MVVELKINTHMKRYDFGRVQVEEGLTVMDCVNQVAGSCPKVNLPGAETLIQHSIVHINSRIAYFDTVVKDADKIIITPQVLDG